MNYKPYTIYRIRENIKEILNDPITGVEAISLSRQIVFCKPSDNNASSFYVDEDSNESRAFPVTAPKMFRSGIIAQDLIDWESDEIYGKVMLINKGESFDEAIRSYLLRTYKNSSWYTNLPGKFKEKYLSYVLKKFRSIGIKDTTLGYNQTVCWMFLNNFFNLKPNKYFYELFEENNILTYFCNLDFFNRIFEEF